MSGDGGRDPTAIRSIAVSAEDLVTALESVRRGRRDAALRITPPFSGRMRARLHVVGGSDDDPRPLHVTPEALVDAETPPYPEVDETADRLRSRGEYTISEHRERHAEAVQDWREAVRDHVVDRVTLDVNGDSHRVDVAVLG